MNITIYITKNLIFLNYFHEGKLYDAEELALSISNKFPEHDY